MATANKQSGSNYGDIRLDLPANWSRANVINKAFMNGSVGHKNGVSEIRLKSDPEQRHAFARVDPNNTMDIDSARDDGYVFVEKSTWDADRWAWLGSGPGSHPEWNAEGVLYCEGLLFMAVTAERWAEIEKERLPMLPPDPIGDELLNLDPALGATVDAPALVARKAQARL